MPYQDEKGHFTTRENDGGPCKHESPDGEPKAKKTIRGGKYLIGDREVTRDEWDAHDGPDEEMDVTTDEDFEIDEKETDKVVEKNEEPEEKEKPDEPEEEEPKEEPTKTEDEIRSESLGMINDLKKSNKVRNFGKHKSSDIYDYLIVFVFVFATGQQFF